MNDRQKEIIEAIKHDKKTKRIAFRCTVEARNKIESIGNRHGLNISQTMEFILTSVLEEFYSENVKTKRSKTISKSELGVY